MRIRGRMQLSRERGRARLPADCADAASQRGQWRGAGASGGGAAQLGALRAQVEHDPGRVHLTGVNVMQPRLRNQLQVRCRRAQAAHGRRARHATGTVGAGSPAEQRSAHPSVIARAAAGGGEAGQVYATGGSYQPPKRTRAHPARRAYRRAAAAGGAVCVVVERRGEGGVGAGPARQRQLGCIVETVKAQRSRGGDPLHV